MKKQKADIEREQEESHGARVRSRRAHRRRIYTPGKHRKHDSSTYHPIIRASTIRQEADSSTDSRTHGRAQNSQAASRPAPGLAGCTAAAAERATRTCARTQHTQWANVQAKRSRRSGTGQPRNYRSTYRVHKRNPTTQGENRQPAMSARVDKD
jgi:hypothetical protein